MPISTYLNSLKKRYQSENSEKKPFRNDLENLLSKLVLGLNKDFAKEIEKEFGLEFSTEEPKEGEVCFAQSPELRDDFKIYFTSTNLLDYSYAAMHSSAYRKTYKKFSKINFSQIPHPKENGQFWKLVSLGKQLRETHLLESSKTEDLITSYPVDGNNKITQEITKNSPGFTSTPLNEFTDKKQDSVVTSSAIEKPFPFKKLKSISGSVWINNMQYFDGVLKAAWELYIGDYQPAQKWLKVRKGHILSREDILHYQKIIVALNETIRLIKNIDEVGFTA